MKLESTSLVVRGNWNVAILSPEWIVSNILRRAGEEVNVLVQLSGPPFVPAYIIEGVKYSIKQARVELFPASWSNEDLSTVERVASSIATALPHTPVRGLGLNFNFVVDELDPATVRKFDVENDILGYLPGEVTTRKTEIHKAFSMGDCILSIMQSLDPNSKYVVRFNYHFDISTIGEVAEILDGGRFMAKKAVTIEVIGGMFGVDPEDIEEEARPT